MLRNNKGIALVIALLVIVVLMILGSVLILRSVAEKRSSDEEKRLIQAFYIAEAGANAALNRIDVLINSDLLNTVNQINPQVLSNRAQQYVTANNGLGFLITYCLENGSAQFTQVVINGTPTAVHNGTTTALGNGNYVYTINVTQKIPPGPSMVASNVYDFPYNYTISSLGTVGGSSKRKVLLSGDFTVRVQQDNFARYALFTNHQGMPSGDPVWFGSDTRFRGPIHTNEYFSFAFNPRFDGLVTQQHLKAQFYNNNHPRLLEADSNPPDDVPIFNAGFNRKVDQINLESSYGQSAMLNEAKGGTSISDNGIYVPNSGGSLTGGIYVKGASTEGDNTVQMGVDVNGDAQYTITQGATTKIITVFKNQHRTTVQTEGGGTDTYNGIPDGISHLGTLIYVDGRIDSLKGTVQKDTEITVASQNDIIITDNVMYQEYNAGPPGPHPTPNADDKTNLLGIVTWGGNVRIGTTAPNAAPNDINIHGTILARNANGIFTVDNYDSISPRGTVTLLGGAITDFYGSFGQFNASGELLYGYGRNFVYDSRMGAGKSPPYFPSMRTFIAFTNDITDKMNWQEGGV